MPTTATQESVPPGRKARPPRRMRTLLIILLVFFVLVGGAGWWAVYHYGPMFGIYPTTPSPARYADIALGYLERGYYAEGPEWEAAKKRVKDAAAGAESYADVHEALKEATPVAGGKHSFFLTPEESTQTATEEAARYVPPEVSTEGGITTVVIPELGTAVKDQLANYAAVAAKGITDAAPTTCGWIIDVRKNRGGNMYPMLSGLSPLIPDGPLMAVRTRQGDDTVVMMNSDGAAVESGKALIPVPEYPKLLGQPIAILQDEGTASSGEAVVTAFRGMKTARTFGTPTAGYTSGNSIYNLYDEAVIVLTGGMYVDRAGVSLDELPIAPDESVTSGQAPKAAAEWLAQQGCSR
ncbi:MAG: S41 family peptidase [Arachnia sp.]